METSELTEIGILTEDQLQRLVDDYFAFDEFSIDVETQGEYRDNPHRNEVFWISLAGPGRADAIPCGHPLGERIPWPDDSEHRRHPTNGRPQLHRVNEETGKLKWFDVPEPFTEPPKQLWISDACEILRPLLFSKKKRKIGQNIKFDIESLAKYYNGVPPPGPYGDTLVAAKLINENEFTYRLESLVQREFHYTYEKIGKRGVEKFPYSEAHLYSYLDAKYAWLLWQAYQQPMEKEKVRHIFDLEMRLLPVLIDMEMHGISIDQDRLDELDEEFSREMARLQIAINKVAGYQINLNANKQVADLVYGTLGKRCYYWTATGAQQVSKEALEHYERNTTISKILDHRSLNKLRGTFIDGARKNLLDGKIHADFDQVGAVSGRLSCRNPNLQQVPQRSERGKKCREVFIASPGKSLVVSDLSQIELRVLAHFTQDPQLLAAYREGLDLHGLTAEKAFGKNWTPLQRSFAKNAGFSAVYGGTARTMYVKYKLPSLAVAESILEGFYSTYRRVIPWKRRTWAEAKGRWRARTRAPFVLTVLGRKRRLPDLMKQRSNFKRYSSAERQAISSVISGTAADLFKLAMIECHRLLAQQDFEAHILMTVHDELVVECPANKTKETVALVKKAMEDIRHPETGEPILTVPIVAETHVVKRWADAK